MYCSRAFSNPSVLLALRPAGYEMPQFCQAHGNYQCALEKICTVAGPCGPLHGSMSVVQQDKRVCGNQDLRAVSACADQ